MFLRKRIPISIAGTVWAWTDLRHCAMIKGYTANFEVEADLSYV